MIGVFSSGNFENFRKFVRRVSRDSVFADLSRYGQIGVQALGSATPIDTGNTAGSWSYEVVKDRSGYSIEWRNSSTIRGGTPVVILLQYGHGTGTGGYVSGIDFINPAIRPVFDQIAHDVWKKVTE